MGGGGEKRSTVSPPGGRSGSRNNLLKIASYLRERVTLMTRPDVYSPPQLVAAPSPPVRWKIR